MTRAPWINDPALPNAKVYRFTAVRYLNAKRTLFPRPVIKHPFD